MPATRNARRAAAAKVELAVDRALKDRWQKAEQVINRTQRQGASAFDELWEAVAEVVEHDPPLYLAAGVATARAFFAKYLATDERTARRMMRVARYASPVEEERYGTSKLDAALEYLEAKTGGALKGRLPVDFDKLKIPVSTNGDERTVLLAEASVEQVRSATRVLKKKPAGKKDSLTRTISAALRLKKLRSVSVRVANGKLSLGSVPLDGLGELAKALARVRLPKIRK